MPPGNSRRHRVARCALAAAFACALASGSAVAAAGRADDDGIRPRPVSTAAVGAGAYAPGEAIVRFEPGTAAAERRAARSAAGAEFERTVGVPQAQLVDVEGPVGLAIRRLERQAGVEYAQPNYRYEAAALSEDTFSEELWGLDDPTIDENGDPGPGVYVEGAWDETRGGGQAIAVLDTGVDLAHPDIAPNLWANSAEEGGEEGVDDDLNGRVDDVHGYDFVDDDGDPDDYEFHGTHVAGTAAAVADNELGVAGVAPEAEIMSVRVLDGDGSGNTAGIAAGIEYAADNGADAINMSLGGPAGSGDELMADAIEAAADAVVVVAAGNDGASNEVEPHSPCVLPQANLICVAALAKSGTLAGFSNYGAKSVDIAAPGTGILSAKADYGSPLFGDGFEAGLAPLWTTLAFDGGVPWGSSDVAANGLQSATDSPLGDYGHAEPGSETLATSELFATEPVDLEGERGCRVHFNTMYEVEPDFDVFQAGAISEASTSDLIELDGTSPGYPSGFQREQASISELDDRVDVHPAFAILSDEIEDRDGAYVDAVRLICRDGTYVDAEATSANYDQAESGNYVRFQGTSMAAPHVAGEVALVRAAAPGLDAEEVVQAVLDGASAIPTFAPGKRTATEGIADACKAIAIATGGDVATACPASSDPVPQPAGGGGSEPPVPAAPGGPPPTSLGSASGTPRSSRRDAPKTFFRRHPPKVLRTEGRTARAVFRFGSDEVGVTFLCKLDRAPFRPCPGKTVRHPAPGSHLFRVKARDADGNTDGTPAVYRFRVERIK